MNAKFSASVFILVGIAGGCLLSGCAHCCSERTSQPAAAKPEGTNAPFAVTATGTNPLFYQWYKTNAAVVTNAKPENTVPTAQFTVTATGTNPLSYQWYFNTNAAVVTNW
jgi:hypothetical protein